MIYVMSDLHGRYDLFKKMLDLIAFDTKDELYILGDVVDRGDQPIPLLTYIKDQENIFMIRGNHEEMMLDYYTKGLKDRWMLNGGDVTRQQIGKYDLDWTRELLTWVARLNYTYEVQVEDQVFRLVHAGLTYHDGQVARKQDSMYMTWARDEFYEQMDVGSDIVIFGHTTTQHLNDDRSSRIWKLGNKICIDCGAAYGGKLACLCLETMEETYVGD